jgi:hypothetical protein
MFAEQLGQQSFDEELYLLRLNSFWSPRRSAAEGVKNGNLDRDLFTVLTAD